MAIDPATGNHMTEAGVIQTVGDASGVSLTSAAFAGAFSRFPCLPVVAVFLFAFSDAAILAMTVVNITALYFLMQIVKRELNSYLSRVK